MSMNKTYAVFGLGKYGSAVALELANHGVDIIAVDKDENIVNEASQYIPLCKCADVTNPEVIKQLGISNVDVVVTTMTENLEANVLAIMLCKEAGVKKVIAKCGNALHKRILQRVGADEIVFPESESGMRLAKKLLSSGFTDLFDLTSDASIVELNVNHDWVGKSLSQLDLRRKYGMNVIAISVDDEAIVDIDPLMPLSHDMKLIVIADPARLAKLKIK